MQLTDAIYTLERPAYSVPTVDREDAARTILSHPNRSEVLVYVPMAQRIVADAVRRDERNAKARARRAMLRDVADCLGMHLVRGPVSGRAYLE